MRRKELVGDDTKSNSLANWMFDNALGNVNLLTADATTVNGLVPQGELGFNPTTLKLFGNFKGKTYLIATASLV